MEQALFQWGATCRIPLCIENWQFMDFAIFCLLFMLVPVLCLLLMAAMACWSSRILPDQKTRLAWLCLSTALHQFDTADSTAKQAMVQQIGLTPTQANFFFEQLRRLLTQVQRA